MSLQLIGAGLPRTGTTSLKAAVEKLTGGACYHMFEVFTHPGHPALWSRVFEGDVDVLDEILEGFSGALDWPVSGAWREVVDRYPDVPVLLSRRSDAEAWWRSADKTVWAVMRGDRSVVGEDWWEMTGHLQRRFASDWDDEATAKAAYDQHLAEVRATVAPGRLVEYQPGDGWAPLCQALGVAVPDEPFPHLNTSEEFVERLTARRE